MPMHDHSCKCGANFEEIVEWDNLEIPCPYCKKRMANRVYKSFRGIEHSAPEWLHSTLEVVDKDSGKAHCNEFLKNPNRDNYKNWLKGEGLRPMAEGEKLASKKMDTSSIRKGVHEKFKKRNALEVRS